MFIVGILIYWIFAYYLYSIIQKSWAYPVQSVFYQKQIKRFVWAFAVICGMRWGVGGDFFSYYFTFANVNFQGLLSDTYEVRNNEYLWSYYVRLVSITRMGWFGMGLTAFIQMYFFTKATKDYKWILLMLPFVMFGSKYWLDLTGAMRQMTAACIFLYVSRYIKEKKMVRYFVLVYICSLIHRSSLILLPLYFIPDTSVIARKKNTALLIYLICIVLGQTQTISALANLSQIITDFLGYNMYEETIVLAFDGKIDDLQFSIGPMYLNYLLIPAFIIWYGPVLYEKYAKSIPYFNIWYTLSYVYACIFALFSQYGDMFVRISLLLVLFQMIMASLLMYELYLYRDSKYKTAFLLFAGLFFLHTSWMIFKDPPSAIYRFIFFH